MKALIITNLFPNKAEPNRAVFNKQQFLALRSLCDIEVIAPLPYFKYSTDSVPYEENIEGIKVYHPRYWVIPKILRSIHAMTFYYSIRKLVKRIANESPFDIIFATWAYPDCCAAARVAKELKKPLVIKVHGSDINFLDRFPRRRALVQKAFKQAKKIVLYVGNLEEVKGVDVLVDAAKDLPTNMLVILAGDGSLRNILEERVQYLALNGHVKFIGSQPHSKIPLWMNAADIFCLPSRNEGCPNVILEALACGLRVVATNVGGIPDLVATEPSAILVERENRKALTQGIMKGLQSAHEKINFQPMSWEENAQKLFQVFRSS